MSKRLAAAGVLGLALLSACGGSSEGDGAAVEATDTPSSPAATSTVGAAGCPAPSGASPEEQQYPDEPKLTVEPTTYKATIVTNCGKIVADLDAKAAPHTVNSFAFLAGKHYFDNTPCHRLTTGGIFVLQCGDPTGTGGGTPGYSIPDENLEGAKYPAGTLAMANSGPNTGGSQFFFVYKDTPPNHLDPNYTPFGHVVKGLDILRTIAKAGSNPPGDGAPVQPVVIESFTVEKSAG
jgi:peptidyl-prolyl cis-trans isomerase B (cyclophilin B)